MSRYIRKKNIEQSCLSSSIIRPWYNVKDHSTFKSNDGPALKETNFLEKNVLQGNNKPHFSKNFGKK